MKFIAILILVVYPIGTMCMNMTAYREMPPMYMLEDYDECMENPKPSTYCLVIGEIVPNDTSVLWNQIKNFSAVTKYHYRHDYLYLGVSLNRCKQLLNSLSSSNKELLYTGGNIKRTEVLDYLTEVLHQESDNRIKYGKVINTCLNYDFKKQYGLQLRSFIHNCVTNGSSPKFGYLEIFFMILVGTLFFLVILSSNYDRQLKNKKQQGYEFYQQRLHTKQDNLLTAFSMYRNYFRLIVPPSSEAAKDFKFFETFRFFACFLVVFAHVTLILKGVPLKNTEFIENIFQKVGASLALNSTVIIQVFLVMSSFFLCIHFQQNYAKLKPGFLHWGQLIFYRYIRLAPSLGFSILLSASILPRLQDGPFWKQIIDADHVLCRETWWRNMLFINNFTLKKSCLQQSWYLATDFQLYIIFAGLLIIMARLPKSRNFILGGGILISFLTICFITYFLKLDAGHQETPDSYRYLFWTNGDTIYKGYTPFYMNFGGYVFGTIAALVYLKFKNEGMDLKGKKSKLNIFVGLSVPLLFLMVLSGEIFSRFELAKPSIWIGVYAGLLRNLWAIMCSILLILMSFKIGFILYRFSSMRMFVPLGRLSFQVYLIHSVVIRLLFGCNRQPIYINHLIFVMYTLAAVAVSIIVAFFLYMMVELPLNTLINTSLKSYVKPQNPVNTNKLVIGNGKKEETIIP